MLCSRHLCRRIFVLGRGIRVVGVVLQFVHLDSLRLEDGVRTGSSAPRLDKEDKALVGRWVSREVHVTIPCACRPRTLNDMAVTGSEHV